MTAIVELTANNAVDYAVLKNKTVPELISNTRGGNADNIFYRVAYDDANLKILFRDGYRDAAALLQHVGVDVGKQLGEAGNRSTSELWFVGPKDQRSIVKANKGLSNSTYWDLDNRSVILSPYPEGARPMRGKVVALCRPYHRLDLLSSFSDSSIDMVVTFTLKPGKDMNKLQNLLSVFYYKTVIGKRDIYYFGFGTE